MFGAGVGPHGVVCRCLSCGHVHPHVGRQSPKQHWDTAWSQHSAAHVPASGRAVISPGNFASCVCSVTTALNTTSSCVCYRPQVPKGVPSYFPQAVETGPVLAAACGVLTAVIMALA
jgi:hypothetical protein